MFNSLVKASILPTCIRSALKEAICPIMIRSKLTPLGAHASGSRMLARASRMRKYRSAAFSDALLLPVTLSALTGFALSGAYCLLDASAFDDASVSARLPQEAEDEVGYAVNAYDEAGELVPELVFNVGLVLAFVPAINWTVRC